MSNKENRGHGFSADKDRILRPLMVDITHPDRLDSALKKLKRLIKDSRIMVEYQDHLEFKRPGQAKREKRLRSIARFRYETK